MITQVQLITQFEAYLLTEKRVAHNTFQAYKTDIDQFVCYLKKGSIDLLAIKNDDLKGFLSHLKALSLSARSMARKISSLKVFFCYLHDRYNIPNCAQDLLYPKIEKKLPQYLSEQEIELILKAIDLDWHDSHYLRNKVMVYLLYASGMRISELTHLKISDVYFDTAFIAVNGKGGKGRMIPIPHEVIALVKKYTETDYRDFMAQEGNRQTDYLFPVYYSQSVRPITRQAFWAILKRICKRAGIKRAISPHQLRHSLATHMLGRGADLRSLQLILGHEHLSTVQLYTHVEKSQVRNVYDKKHPRS